MGKASLCQLAGAFWLRAAFFLKIGASTNGFWGLRTVRKISIEEQQDHHISLSYFIRF
jgi:hypothetical protein